MTAGTLLTCASLACAHRQTRARPTLPSATGDSAATNRETVGRIVVRIENRSSFDVTIYAVRGSLRQRIGSVAGVSRTSVTVPATFTSDLGAFSIAVTRIAGNETFVSDPVTPQPGIRLLLTIQSRIVNSALSVE